MIRAPIFALLLVGTVVVSGDRSPTARGELPVAPPPREIKPDGSRPPAPQPAPPAKAEDPAVIIDRIIKNSKAAEEKLATPGGGPAAIELQKMIRDDLAVLLNPPPHDKNTKQDKNNKDDQKDKQKDPMSKPDMMPMPDPMPMQKGMAGGQDMMPQPMPQGGQDEPQPKGVRRPRPDEPTADDPKKDKEPGGGATASKPKDDPNQKNVSGGAKDPKDPAEKKGTGSVAKLPAPLLPYDDSPNKEEWGYYPEKMRGQMPLYFKEDFMQRYDKLLRLYYSPEPTPRPGKP